MTPLFLLPLILSTYLGMQSCQTYFKYSQKEEGKNFTQPERNMKEKGKSQGKE